MTTISQQLQLVENQLTEIEILATHSLNALDDAREFKLDAAARKNLSYHNRRLRDAVQKYFALTRLSNLAEPMPRRKPKHKNTKTQN